jgi:hypothetical protein
MLKTLLATASLSLAMLLMPISYGPIQPIGSAGISPALADIDVEIGVGDDDDDDGGFDDDDRGRISCSRGERIVRRAGFHRVRARDCNGRIYRYTGRRHGDTFLIGVHSRRGSIQFVREID